jgi:predicted ribonuclease YlaK
LYNKPRKKKRQKKNSNSSNVSLDIIEVEAKTKNQELMIKSLEDNDVALVHGFPGTGKTFISLYMALTEIDLNPDFYKKVLILRSAVSSRDMGFLPGNVKEKMKEFEVPYIEIVNKLYNRDDAWGILNHKDMIEFAPSSFLRGRTLENTIIIVDEFQNMSFQELNTIITRMGEDSKLIILGDTGQDDLTSKRYNEESGASKILEVFSKLNVPVIKMEADDIVRSGFVKEYICALYDI